MIHFFSELRYKEVIDIHSGFRLGYVCDAEYDDAEGRLLSLITPGRAKLFGLLGREDDYVLPWTCIVRVGRDIILVDTKEGPARCRTRCAGGTSGYRSRQALQTGSPRPLRRRQKTQRVGKSSSSSPSRIPPAPRVLSLPSIAQASASISATMAARSSSPSPTRSGCFFR